MGVTEAVTLEQARRIMDTNFFGAVRMNRAVLRISEAKRRFVDSHQQRSGPRGGAQHGILLREQVGDGGSRGGVPL